MKRNILLITLTLILMTLFIAGPAFASDYNILNADSADLVVEDQGDIDGDGIDDVLIGASQTGENGTVFVFLGKNIEDATLDLKASDYIITGEENESLGHAVSFGDDEDGDDLDEILIASGSDEVVILSSELSDYQTQTIVGTEGAIRDTLTVSVGVAKRADCSLAINAAQTSSNMGMGFLLASLFSVFLGLRSIVVFSKNEN